MDSIRLKAPAKVNLFLKVTGRRKDSYHNIVTLFERLSLSDEITISKAKTGISVTSDKFITARPEDNTVYKAAALILNLKKIKSGVKIHIKKRAPIAGGMGGGSSDAASTLIGINRLFGLKCKSSKLMSLGAKVGADVPFFVMDTPFAIGRSRGDVLRKVKLDLKLWHLVICPDFKLSTKDIYDEYDRSAKALTTLEEDDKIQLLSRRIEFDELEAMMCNDLGDIAASKNKKISGIVECLAVSCGKKAMVSGSGPSVFCVFRTEREVMEAWKRFLKAVPARERKGWSIAIAATG